MADPINDRVRRLKWHGILVEPQRREFELLRSTYGAETDNLIFENVAIAETNGMRTLYKIKDELMHADWQRGAASLIPNPGFAKLDMLTTEAVDCITFERLFERHNVQQIDLLQLDVEGYDYQLIKSFDFERIKPKMIRYEHMHLSFTEQQFCIELLEQNGYVVLKMENDTGAIL